MAITLYQESIPLSNKRVTNPISQNNSYTNPVIMSYAYDGTVAVNVLETVLYIRNDEPNKYYRNIVVTLMKSSGDPAALANGIIKNVTGIGPCLQLGPLSVPASWSVEQPPILPENGVYLANKYNLDSTPILDFIDANGVRQSSDENVSVKFSFGYDELSNAEWQLQKDALIIPTVGNMSMPDTSYIPVRMRMYWKSVATLATVRDYFIDVSYEQEQVIGVAMPEV